MACSTEAKNVLSWYDAKMHVIFGNVHQKACAKRQSQAKSVDEREDSRNT